MKQLLRRWLEIPEPVDTRGFVDKNAIRSAVAEAVGEALSPRLPTGYVSFFWDYDELKRLRGLVQKHVHTLCDDQARETTQKYIEENIDQEAFVDDVVARIRRKQLSE